MPDATIRPSVPGLAERERDSVDPRRGFGSEDLAETVGFEPTVPLPEAGIDPLARSILD